MTSAQAGNFFSKDKLLDGGSVVEIPNGADICLAMIGSCPTVSSPQCGIGIVYFAVCKREQSTPLTVLDWDLQPITAETVGGWDGVVSARLAELSKNTKAPLPPVVCIEATETGREMFNNAQKNECRIVYSLTDLFNSNASTSNRGLEDLAARALSAGFVLAEGNAKISTFAYDKTQAFQGLVSNHFFDQYLSYRMSQAHSAGTELVSAFCAACTLWHFNML